MRPHAERADSCRELAVLHPAGSNVRFRDQVVGLVETAADYKCQLVVFPEYFSLQLLTLGNIRRPIREQIQDPS